MPWTPQVIEYTQINESESQKKLSHTNRPLSSFFAASLIKAGLCSAPSQASTVVGWVACQTWTSSGPCSSPPEIKSSTSNPLTVPAMTSIAKGSSHTRRRLWWGPILDQCVTPPSAQADENDLYRNMCLMSRRRSMDAENSAHKKYDCVGSRQSDLRINGRRIRVRASKLSSSLRERVCNYIKTHLIVSFRSHNCVHTVYILVPCCW